MSNEIELEAMPLVLYELSLIISRREEEGAAGRRIHDDQNINIVLTILDSAFAISLHKYGHRVIQVSIYMHFFHVKRNLVIVKNHNRIL